MVASKNTINTSNEDKKGIEGKYSLLFWFKLAIFVVFKTSYCRDDSSVTNKYFRHDIFVKMCLIDQVCGNNKVLIL